MKSRTASVADLRNHFRRVSAWLENGEEVEIIRRGKKFARLIPARDPSAKFVKVDFEKQLKKTWGNRVFSEVEVLDMRQAELGTRS